MLAALAKESCSAGIRDQFGRPVASPHQRIEPFQDGHARLLLSTERVTTFAQTLQALLVALYELPRLFLARESVSNAQEVFPDIGQPMRREGHNTRLQAGQLFYSAHHISFA